MKQNVMTIGFREQLASGSFSAIVFHDYALKRISEKEPSMIIGTSEGKFNELGIRTEDDGRTLVIQTEATSPKLYACINETGGATLMLAEEY